MISLNLSKKLKYAILNNNYLFRLHIFLYNSSASAILKFNITKPNLLDSKFKF